MCIFKKMMYKFHIVLETEHFLLFFPNLNENGYLLFSLYIVYHTDNSLAKLFIFFYHSKDVSEKSARGLQTQS